MINFMLKNSSQQACGGHIKGIATAIKTTDPQFIMTFHQTMLVLEVITMAGFTEMKALILKNVLIHFLTGIMLAGLKLENG